MITLKKNQEMITFFSVWKSKTFVEEFDLVEKLDFRLFRSLETFELHNSNLTGKWKDYKR